VYDCDCTPEVPHRTSTAPSRTRSARSTSMVKSTWPMQPLQAKMAAQLPMFMDQLTDETTGQLPDLHVAVLSSSYGGGAWSNVNQCLSGKTPGDNQGKFQQGPGGAGNGHCTGLNPGETYLKTGDGTSANPPNFQGDIRPCSSAWPCWAMGAAVSRAIN